MNESTIWWLIAGALVGIELTTGTFYLLMLAIGASAAALAGHAQVSLTLQICTGALVGALAVTLWRMYSLQKLKQASPEMSPQHLDIGETVNVTAWDNAGHAQVKHRGALWAATTVEGSVSGLTPEPGIYLIHDIQGNTLVLRKK